MAIGIHFDSDDEPMSLNDARVRNYKEFDNERADISRIPDKDDAIKLLEDCREFIKVVSNTDRSLAGGNLLSRINDYLKRSK